MGILPYEHFTLDFLDLFWQDSAIAFNNSSSSEDLHPSQPTSGWEHLAKMAPLLLCLIFFVFHSRIL